ncbi:terpenoid cyclases/Protein prenyltransferase [Penicillium malachiteum]|uniref:Terpenoid cyclases/Protein prenyltransferase n=1 Tax=Penicillium malachiteum TaxID=1324776 RepID=A0AAD6MW81_9EURO|nr:terpenoid cyclases/Protein prenyltransferase [Penicillium malachiteum]
MAFENNSSVGDLLSYLGNLLNHGDTPPSQFGSFSPSIYDSAWVAMVYKPLEVEAGEKWMFPQCFEYILSQQRDDGTWPAFSSQVDGILATGASLLTLLHRKGRVTGPDQEDLLQRIDRGVRGLHSLLQDWDVANSDQVGFEIIIPNILSQIQYYHVDFSFPGQECLQSLHVQKLRKFHPDLLYSNFQTTILHSLEALVGIIDFDKIAHHCTAENGVMASPAATSAYLVHSSTWDTRAEEYLSRVVELAGDNCGGVPAAFPTGNFELSWAISTLFLHTVHPNEEQMVRLLPLRSFFEALASRQNGLIGWAPGIMPDADDTARVLMTIGFLGGQADLMPMVTKFRSDPCFKTYEMERNPSLSANCNILLALASSENAKDHMDDIRTVMKYLNTIWRQGDLRDKWNTSSHYSCMILCSALVKVLQIYGEDGLTNLDETSIVQDISLCLVQMLSQTLELQSHDGSWDDSLEVTAYCVLIIAQMMRLPFSPEFIRGQLHSALTRGQSYISAHFSDAIDPNRHNYIWTEKISYSTRLLRKVYSVAALNANTESLTLHPILSQHFSIPNPFRRMELLLQSIPMFQKSPPCSWHLTLLEASLWSASLEKSKHDIFPPFHSHQTKDKHIVLIPLIFTACNHMSKHKLSPNTIWQMIFVSLLMYQSDEFMEHSVAHLSKHEREELWERVKYECLSAPSEGPADPAQKLLSEDGDFRSEDTDSHAQVDPHLSKEEILSTLRSLIQWLRGHERVLATSELMQSEFAGEIYTFLSSHITHLESNAELSLTKYSSKPDYLRWVWSIGADDTSCPLGSLFFLCLTSNSMSTAFESSPLERYLSRSVFRHLAVMCRQYNDYGSANRDIDEFNLSSFHFPEFRLQLQGNKVDGINYPSPAMKEQLLAIADFERSRLEHALNQLELVSGEKAALASLKVFINVTDLFGLMYVHEDFSNRVKHQTHPVNSPARV